MPAEEVVFDRGLRGGIEMPRIETGMADVRSRLGQNESPLGQVGADKAFGGPDAEAPDRRRVDAAGTQVGQAAVGKANSRLHDVLVSAEYCCTQGLDADNWRADE